MAGMARDYAGKIYESAWVQWLRRNNGRCLLALFAVVALAEGLVFSHKIPLGQIPDEMAHYSMMESAFGTTGYTDQVYQVYVDGGYSEMPWHAENKMNLEAARNVSDQRFSSRPGLGEFHPNINVIKYLPAGMGFYIGAMLGLPIVTCTYMAEIFSVLFFVIVGCVTIKVTPVKKEIFAFCMLIPECLQQCSSISYDAVLIPCSLLLFAYVLKLYSGNDKIGWKALVAIAAMTIVIGIIKPPYAMIGLTMLILPFSRFELKLGRKCDLAVFIRKYWWLVVALVLLAGMFAVYLLRGKGEILTVVSDLLRLPAFLGLLIRTYRSLGYYHYNQMVGVFGWLESWVTNAFVVVFSMMMVYLNTCRVEKVDREINPLRRIVLFLVALIVMILIEMGLQHWTYSYLSWDTAVPLSVYKDYVSRLDSILGVQGRYWIPCLPIILVSLSGKSERKNIPFYYLVQAVYYSATFLNVLYILNNRYWP